MPPRTLIPRERLTPRVERLLKHLDQPGEFTHLLQAVYVFGSYGRGAPMCGDVDVFVVHTTDDPKWAEHRRACVNHFLKHWKRRSVTAPLRRDLGNPRFPVEVRFSSDEDLLDEGVPETFEMTLLWVKGESAATALARLHDIPVVATAGRFPDSQREDPDAATL